MKTFIRAALGPVGFAFGTNYRRAREVGAAQYRKQHVSERARVMQVLTFVLLGAALAACDVQEGPPLYNNPPPAPAAAVQRGLGQAHTDCPSGYSMC